MMNSVAVIALIVLPLADDDGDDDGDVGDGRR